MRFIRVGVMRDADGIAEETACPFRGVDNTCLISKWEGPDDWIHTQQRCAESFDFSECPLVKGSVHVSLTAETMAERRAMLQEIESGAMAER